MSEVHNLLPNSAPEVAKAMMKKIGLKSVDALFKDIPEGLLLKRELNLPHASDQPSVERHVEGLLKRNRAPPDCMCFLGGGVWPHYVPAAVDEIVSRSEFYTSYTPYQPEASQGLLQALFEYQSMICDLTGMDVANSSLYDWPTAVGEAARMAMRVTSRRKIVVSRSVGPERLRVLRTYCQPLDAEVHVTDFEHKTGRSNLNHLASAVDDNTAAVYVENPNFFGVIEDQVSAIGELAHRRKALFIVGCDPISLGVLKPPGEYGADIAVGEGQPLGLHMNFGGPLLGILAAKGDSALLRQMPGRIVGLTSTQEGQKRGFTLILQTREQHIRRETATSNICTSEALCALAAAVYLSLIGPEGLKELGRSVVENSHYAARLLSEVPGVECPHFDSPFFKDFTLALDPKRAKPEDLFLRLLNDGVLGGLPLHRFYQDLPNVSLFSVTEVHTEDEIRCLAHAVARVAGDA